MNAVGRSTTSSGARPSRRWSTRCARSSSSSAARSMRSRSRAEPPSARVTRRALARNQSGRFGSEPKHTIRRLGTRRISSLHRSRFVSIHRSSLATRVRASVGRDPMGDRPCSATRESALPRAAAHFPRARPRVVGGATAAAAAAVRACARARVRRRSAAAAASAARLTVTPTRGPGNPS